MEGKCVFCGICEKACPAFAVTKTEKGMSADASRCIACGHCTAVCPTGAFDNPRCPAERQMPVLPVLPKAQAENFLRTRRSIRMFKKEGASRQEIEELCSIGRFAQTGVNYQGVSYIVVDNRDKLDALAEVTLACLDELGKTDPNARAVAAGCHFVRKAGGDMLFRGAPQFIIALYRPGNNGSRENCRFSLTYIELFAPSLGLGTCWSGYFEMASFNDSVNAPIRAHLGLEDDVCVGGALMLGYPDVSYLRHPDREPLEISWL